MQIKFFSGFDSVPSLPTARKLQINENYYNVFCRELHLGVDVTSAWQIRAAGREFDIPVLE